MKNKKMIKRLRLDKKRMEAILNFKKKRESVVLKRNKEAMDRQFITAKSVNEWLEFLF